MSNVSDYIKILGAPLVAGGFMQINSINGRQQFNIKGVKYVREDISQTDKSDILVGELDKMSMINNVGITKPEFELGLTREELEKRTHKDYLTTKKMLGVDIVAH